MRANGGLNPSQHRGNLLGETTESHVPPGIVPHTLSRLQVRDIDTFYAEQWLLPAQHEGVDQVLACASVLLCLSSWHWRVLE